MLFYVLFATGLLLAVCGSVVWRKRLVIKRRLRGQAINDWLRQYRDCPHWDYDKLRQLPPVPPGWDNLPEVAVARLYIQEAEKTYQRHQKAQRLLADAGARFTAEVQALREADSVDDKFDVLMALRGRSYGAAEEDLVWVQEQITRLATEAADAMLERARQGDAESFHAFKTYVFAHRFDEDGYRYQASRNYPTIEDWNELLVRFVKKPVFADFQSVRTEYASGEVRLLAAEALRKGSLVKAQLVLALCDERRARRGGPTYFPWREEVGDVLLAELAKLVDILHAEMTVKPT